MRAPCNGVAPARGASPGDRWQSIASVVRHAFGGKIKNAGARPAFIGIALGVSPGSAASLLVPAESSIRGARACARVPAARSEEHTSELQSRENLVCRLL